MNDINEPLPWWSYHTPRAQAWREIFPEARVLSATFRIAVIAEFLLNAEDDLPKALRQDLDVSLLKTPLLQEAVFWHKPSASLLVADSGFFVSSRWEGGRMVRHVYMA